MEPIPKWYHPLDKAKDPPMDKATIMRYSCDTMNCKLMRIDFDYPPQLYANGSSVKAVNYNSHFLERTEGFQELLAAHLFCGKVAVLYGLNDAFDCDYLCYGLYKQFYETVEIEITLGRWYAQFPFKPVDIRDDGRLKTVQGLIGAHQELMSQVESRLKAADVEPPRQESWRARELEDHPVFKFFPTMKDLFVVTDSPTVFVDEGWMFDTQHRALLVVLRKNRKDTIDAHLGDEKLEVCEMNGQPVWIARAGLKEIMHALIIVGFPDRPHFPVRITEKADLE